MGLQVVWMNYDYFKTEGRTSHVYGLNAMTDILPDMRNHLCGVR